MVVINFGRVVSVERWGNTMTGFKERKKIVDNKSRHLFQGILRERKKWDGNERRKWGQDIHLLEGIQA